MSCVIPVASALFALQVPAQDLVIALRSVAEVANFPQMRGFRDSFGDFFSWLGYFRACA